MGILLNSFKTGVFCYIFWAKEANAHFGPNSIAIYFLNLKSIFKTIIQNVVYFSLKVLKLFQAFYIHISIDASRKKSLK